MMMRQQEHHHIPNANMQRDPNSVRMGMHRIPTQPRNQPPIMVPSPIPVQQTGVLVTVATGPTMITTTPVPQQAAAKPAPPPVAVEGEDLSLQTLPNQNTQQSNNSTMLPTVLANTKEKTPMCLINELARYNKIQHQYRLTSEQGLAHQKRFTVILRLGTEEYEAEGASIKKAQHSAAAEALLNTDFKHPTQKPPKIMRTPIKSRTGFLTPTVELNALAMKRGERTMYLLETIPPSHAPYINQTGYFPPRNAIYPQGQGGHGQPRYGFDARRGGRGGAAAAGVGPAAAAAASHAAPPPAAHYMGHYEQRFPPYNQYKAQVYPHMGASGELFSVLLRVGVREYTGEGHTVQAARHNAASKALHELKQLPLPGEIERTAAVPDLNTDLKSPISLVHEIALKRFLTVTFEVISEKGPPHMREFITVCRVGELVTEAEGNGKKISKKRAAEKMLEKLSQLPPLPYVSEINPRIKRRRVIPKKKIRNLIKVNQVGGSVECSDLSHENTTDAKFSVQDKPGADYSEDINPISRLIQIQQASKEKEPIYTVIEERGVPRRREFVMEASVNGIACVGTGPNKKVAKRAAAEALLETLGYTKTSPAVADQSTTVKVEKDGSVSVPLASASNVIPSPSTESQEKSPISVQLAQVQQRKVKFAEEKNDTSSGNVGGPSGRQLVPGLLLMGEQSAKNAYLPPVVTATPKTPNINMQQTATIAKEFLKAGNSPTADALAGKSGSTKMTQTTAKTTQSTTTANNASSTTASLRSKDQLLYLAQLLNLQVQFSDFPKANHEMYLTLVSLSTTPPQVCHGEGPTTDASHEKAALEALTMLSELGLDNVIPKKEQSPAEG